MTETTTGLLLRAARPCWAPPRWPRHRWPRPTSPRAAAEPIKIGLLLAKTGQIAAQTEYLANGTYLALEERNNTIMGQPAELVWLDEPSPQARSRTCRSWCRRTRSVAVLGGSLSSNALAEEATAAQLKIPFVCDNAAATEISGKNCNRYTFRLNTPVAVQARMFAPLHHELRQEVVSHHRLLRVRPGHRASRSRRLLQRPAAPRSGRRRGAAEHAGLSARSS